MVSCRPFSATMSIRLILAILCIACLPSVTLAATVKNFETDFSITQKEQAMRACVHADTKARERCEARVKKRAEAEWGKSNPVTAFELYDSLDWGKNHLRYDLQVTRKIENQKYWSINRRTFSELTPTDDVNTQRLPYVNTVRAKRLDCMYEPAGRPRALCLDRQKDAAQKMKAPEAGK